LLVVGLSTSEHALPHTLEDLLRLPLHQLMQVEFSSPGAGRVHATHAVSSRIGHTPFARRVIERIPVVLGQMLPPPGGTDAVLIGHANVLPNKRFQHVALQGVQ
jgi:hypothetical protein